VSTGSPEPLRVVVADDHPFYRSGLGRSLKSHGIAVVAEASNGANAIRAVRETAPDVVVMDLNMPGVSGLEATRELISDAPETRVLVLTVSADETDLIDAIVAGACGYVLKDRPVQEVVEGIRAAAAGRSHFSAQLAMPLLRRLREPSGIEVDLSGVDLDALEHDVLGLIADGMSDLEIAETLGISQSEVRSQASGILAKLEPDQRVQAARRASGKRRA
jgi:DNA-binding NarL/FixJ family response regulator